MNSDCIGCPYFGDVGRGEKVCTAPIGCRLDSTDDDYFTGDAKPSAIGGFDIHGISTALMAD